MSSFSLNFYVAYTKIIKKFLNYLQFLINFIKFYQYASAVICRHEKFCNAFCELYFNSYICAVFRDKIDDMRYRLLLNLARVCFAVMLIGCSTDGKIMEQIYEAEALVQQNPEKALEVIGGVDRSLLRGQSDRARYALVMSEAMYHNYIDSDSDTLSRSMAETRSLEDSRYTTSHLCSRNALRNYRPSAVLLAPSSAH